MLAVSCGNCVLAIGVYVIEIHGQGGRMFRELSFSSKCPSLESTFTAGFGRCGLKMDVGQLTRVNHGRANLGFLGSDQYAAHASARLDQ